MRAVLLVSLAIVMMTSASAVAQSLGKTPSIDSFPQRVGYRADARIDGHLDNYTPGDEVTLQRRGANAWHNVEAKPVNEDGNVTYLLTARGSTSRYRLLYEDPTTGDTARSEVATIAVVPRLTLWPSRRNVLRGGFVGLSGVLKPAAPDREVVLEQRVDGEWRTIAIAGAGDGEFSITMRARRAGVRGLRARFLGDAANLRAREGASITVYRRAEATWYGPGLYGNSTACGRRLTRETLGVAHRTLPCGTEVDIFYNGRTISVPVIDRGPYTSADFDLTSRTARRLGFSGTDRIGVVTGP